MAHTHSHASHASNSHLDGQAQPFRTPDPEERDNHNHEDLEIPKAFSFGGSVSSIPGDSRTFDGVVEPFSETNPLGINAPYSSSNPYPSSHTHSSTHNPYPVEKSNIPYPSVPSNSNIPYPTPSERIEKTNINQFRVDLRPLLSKLVGTLPVLVTFPSILLSSSLAFIPTTSVSSLNYVSTLVSVLVFLACVFLLLVRFILRFILRFVKNSKSQVSDTSTKSSLVVTLYLIGAVSVVYFSSHVISINRLSVLLLGLYLNQFNPYSLISVVLDVYNAPDLQGVVTTLAMYILVVVAFKILFKRFVLSSIATTIASLDYFVLFSGLIISGFALLVSGNLSDSISISIIGVNVAASLVFIVSLHDSDLKASPLIPCLLSILSTTLEYVLASKSVSFSTIVDLVSPLLIKVDRSYDLPVEESLETFVSTSILKELLRHSDTRAIFNFLLLNTTFMFVQLLYSFRSKSLGLLSDSLHMALDCTSLALGLLAGILSKNEINANGKFPFGLKNFEILAGFTNGTLLVGISGSIVFEAIGRLWNPIVLQKTNELIIVSILGLLVNLVGIFAFNHGHDHGHGHGHSHGHSHTQSHSHTESHSHADSHSDPNSHSNSHSDSHSPSNEECNEGMNDNMKGIFLHILADTLGSVGVVISTILTKIFNWDGFDPIASIIIAVLIFFSAIPLIKSTGSTLLLKLTNDKENKIRSVLNNITQIRGIKSFTTPRFWPNSSNTINGYIHIQVYRGENIPNIKKQCEKLFVAEHIDAMIQMENDYDNCWCRSDSDIIAT